MKGINATFNTLSFVDELVNLNTLVPVRHLGFESTVASGIANVPDTAPLASATILPVSYTHLTLPTTTPV